MRMDENILTILQALEARVDANDQVLAHLYQAYVELASLFEGVLTQIIKPLEPEAAKEFGDNLTQHRRDMLAMVKDVADAMAGGSVDDDTAMEAVDD